ncbi:MAG: glutaminase [Staphylococcus sp.]|nr:glutaminase [Staphylococcus sp.]
MDRKIKLTDIKSAVQEAYDNHKNDVGGVPSDKVAGMNDGMFGISIRLTDGTKFDVGHSQAQFAMGAISRLPIAIQLLTQMKVEDYVNKMGLTKGCGCGCKCNPDSNATANEGKKVKGMHGKAVRAASLVEPIGDFDGKMEILSNLMIDLMGSTPVLDDKLYEAASKKNEDKDIVNSYAAAGYELYDDAALSLNLYTRLRSMLVTTEQLAEMGATVAADGINPASNTPVFDGSLSATICAMLAAKGPKKVGKTWLILTGIPAISGFGGGFLAVIPGFGSIAAFSPELNEAGVPMKAARAVKEIADKLQLNAFSSARISVEK